MPINLAFFLKWRSDIIKYEVRGLEPDETISRVEVDEDNHQVMIYYQNNDLEVIEITGENSNDTKKNFKEFKDEIKDVLESQAEQYVKTKNSVKNDIKNTREEIKLFINKKFKNHRTFLIILSILIIFGLSSIPVVYGVILASVMIIGKTVIRSILDERSLKQAEQDIDKYAFFIENKDKIEKNGQKRKEITGQEKVDIFNIDKANLEELKYLLEYSRLANDYQEQITHEEPIVNSYVKKKVNKRR